MISDRVEKLEETGARKVVLRGRLSTAFVSEIRAMNGTEVSDPVLEDSSASFLYNGDISRLMALLAAEKLRDVSITEPTMEEIFLNYYERGQEARS